HGGIHTGGWWCGVPDRRRRHGERAVVAGQAGVQVVQLPVRPRLGLGRYLPGHGDGRGGRGERRRGRADRCGGRGGDRRGHRDGAHGGRRGGPRGRGRGRGETGHQGDGADGDRGARGGQQPCGG